MAESLGLPYRNVLGIVFGNVGGRLPNRNWFGIDSEISLCVVASTNFCGNRVRCFGSNDMLAVAMPSTPPHKTKVAAEIPDDFASDSKKVQAESRVLSFQDPLFEHNRAMLTSMKLSHDVAIFWRCPAP